MPFDRSELKSASRESLRGNLGAAVLLLLVAYAANVISALAIVGPLIVGGPLALGASLFFLNLAKRQDPEIADLFSGFKQFVEAFVAYVFIAIFVILWSLLLIVPGIMAAIRYSQTWFIMIDNPGISGREAIKRSMALMKGHEGEYFVLHLSFFWWHCLGIITFGIGYVYVLPYLATALSGYYLRLKEGAEPGLAT